MLFFHMWKLNLMCQSVNLYRKIAVWNVGFVCAYFCGEHFCYAHIFLCNKFSHAHMCHVFKESSILNIPERVVPPCT